MQSIKRKNENNPLEVLEQGLKNKKVKIDEVE